jgi:hypothetical protein
METTVNSEPSSAGRGEAEDGELSRDTTKEIMSMAEETHDLPRPEDENSTKKEEPKAVSNTEHCEDPYNSDENAIDTSIILPNKDENISPKLSVSDSPIAEELDNAGDISGRIEGLSEDLNVSKEEESKVLNTKECNMSTFKKDGETVLSKSNVLDASAVNAVGSAMNERNCQRSAAGKFVL